MECPSTSSRASRPARARDPGRGWRRRRRAATRRARHRLAAARRPISRGRERSERGEHEQRSREPVVVAEVDGGRDWPRRARRRARPSGRRRREMEAELGGDPRKRDDDDGDRDHDARTSVARRRGANADSRAPRSREREREREDDAERGDDVHCRRASRSLWSTTPARRRPRRARSRARRHEPCPRDGAPPSASSASGESQRPAATRSKFEAGPSDVLAHDRSVRGPSLRDVVELARVDARVGDEDGEHVERRRAPRRRAPRPAAARRASLYTSSADASVSATYAWSSSSRSAWNGSASVRALISSATGQRPSRKPKRSRMYGCRWMHGR